MVDARRIFGDSAEALAGRYLEAKGLRVIAQNFRTRYGEIDLIAMDGNEVVFVEVKARKTAEFGYPEEAVTRSKLAKIAHCAATYLRQQNWENKPHRIDVVAILFTTDPPDIHHVVGVA